MFAYCNNNPANYYDPTGRAALVCATADTTILDPFFGIGGGGSGGGCAYALSAVTALEKSIEKVESVVDNSNPVVVQQNLQENGIAFYNGALVVSAPLPVDKTALSYGVIVMDDYYQNVLPDFFAETLNHENGHFLHMQAVGVASYTITSAIPSIIGAGMANSSIPVLYYWFKANYFNLPWERIADYYGNVSRDHSSIANATGAIYWFYTYITGLGIN